ncbi:MAG: s-methyl-5-thioribose-1-phosphate isomerase [Bacillota bacterium]
MTNEFHITIRKPGHSPGYGEREEEILQHDSPLLMHIRNTICWQGGCLKLLDRRRLPHIIEFREYTSYEDVARAIEDMVVQGAGHIAITAGYGVALAAMSATSGDRCEAARIAIERMRRTRPTGSRLFSMLDELSDVIDSAAEAGGDPSAAIVTYVERYIDANERSARLCGCYAADLLEDGDRVLTHCFAGPALLFMLEKARRDGKKISVFASETRPYLQGARLTSFAIAQMGIGVTLITDNMPAYCMSAGLVQKVVTATDRISLDGYVANKIGTYQYAIAASYHRIPFYILGYGGPDPKTKSNADIKIEMRDPSEVTSFMGVSIVAPGVTGFYPAFDITPPELITAIITDRGVFKPAAIADYLVASRREQVGC